MAVSHRVDSAPATPDQNDRLTTVGLLMEAAAGLRKYLCEVQQTSQADDSTQSSAVQAGFDVLIRLARSPGGELRMSELAAQASLTPSGLTRSVDRLHREGLVERRLCPEDRRGAYATLTAKGRRVMDELLPDHVSTVNQLLDDVFSPDEEEVLHRLLRQLRDKVWNLNAGGESGMSCSG
jgi:DNA-binding MarR family transcriptional regulator